MKITKQILDDLVFQSEYDKELRDCLIFVDEMAFKEKTTMLDMMNRILGNSAEIHAKKWLKDKQDGKL